MKDSEHFGKVFMFVGIHCRFLSPLSRKTGHLAPKRFIVNVLVFAEPYNVTQCYSKQVNKVLYNISISPLSAVVYLYGLK